MSVLWMTYVNGKTLAVKVNNTAFDCALEWLSL